MTFWKKLINNYYLLTSSLRKNSQTLYDGTLLDTLGQARSEYRKRLINNHSQTTPKHSMTEQVLSEYKKRLITNYY